ncbi:MAG: 2-(1,2-epoxy-1,2-dihydrophenyl)acetyl-CoA isomerase [Gammaproteobacteria bacterium]
MADQAEPLLYETDDGVALITINRPKVMNAFSDEVRSALFETLSETAANGSIRCVVITGAGKAFSAGGDIANMVALQEADDARTIAARIEIAGKVMALIRSMPKPVIAAVNGAAAGGGMNLALGCDIRLGSTDAFFSEAFVKIGLIPDWGGFHALTRIVGTSKAMELMMSGDRVEADEAHRLGLIDQLFDASQFHERTMAYARRLATGPAQALAHIKEGVYLGASGAPADVVAYERSVQSELFLSSDAREGMRAFLQKRQPRFGGSDADS